MKKVLPFLLLVLLAFAGCQNGPAEYEFSTSPHQIAVNAEKFAKQVEKQSKNYTIEEWGEALEQFIGMSKNYHEYRKGMTPEDQTRYDNARIRFMNAVSANGSEEMAIKAKSTYSDLMGK